MSQRHADAPPSPQSAPPALSAPSSSLALPTRHALLDMDSWTPSEIRALLARAEAFQREPGLGAGALAGEVLVNLFYENSTRTRVSFEVAARRLGAEVVNVTATASSVAKGESLHDTVATLRALGATIVVVRSSYAGAADLIARIADVGVLNAGDGWHAHPTQALLDLFTLERHWGTVAGKRIVILGDIMHSRVARSNVWALTTMGAEVILCGPPTLLPPDAAALYTSHRVPEIGAVRRVIVEPDVARALAGADAVMALRIQRERQEAGLLPSLGEYTARYGLSPQRLALAKMDALVLHPGPMNEGIEILPEVAHGPASLVEEQVASGVPVRMAALEMVARARHEQMQREMAARGRQAR